MKYFNKDNIIFNILRSGIFHFFLFILLFTNYFCFASDEAVTILMNSYLNSGFNPHIIKTAYGEFEVETILNDPVLAQMESEFRQNNAAMIREKYKGNEEKINSELAKIDIPIINNSSSTAKLKLLMSGNDHCYSKNPGNTFLRMCSIENYAPKLNQFVLTDISISFGAVNQAGSCMRISWIPNNTLMNVSYQLWTVAEFQYFGRFQELAASTVALLMRNSIERESFSFQKDTSKLIQDELNKSGLTCEVTGEITYDSNENAVVIEVKKHDQVLEIYHIDVSRGYLCPYMKVIHTSGQYSTENTASNFVKEDNSGLYYPTLYITTRNDNVGSDSTQKYSLVLGSLQLNQPVSVNQFSIDVSEGANVVDSRNIKKPIEYTALEEGVVSLAPGGYDFEKMGWLIRKDSIQDDIPHKGGMSGIIRAVFVFFGALLIFSSLYFKWKKRKSPTLSIIVFILLPLILSKIGCSNTNSEQLPDNTPKQSIDRKFSLSATPSIIDFGTVRSTDSTVRCVFDLCNNGRKILSVKDIISGCGCTVIDIPKTPISPGDKISVPFRVNVQGRYGDFHNKLIIQTTNGESFSVGIYGKIVSDIWANGQSLRCSVGSKESITSTILTLYTDKYSDILFDEEVRQDSGVTLKEISRHTEGVRTVIQMSVELDVGDKDIFTSNLNIVPKDRSIAPIIVPVICCRNEES